MTPVLIVGGSLAGLSAALFCAHYGVSAVLVERHRSTSIHLRARLVGARSLELYRSVGLEDAVRAAGDSLETGFSVVQALTDEHYQPVGRQQDETLAVSPTGMWQCDQEKLEPLLAARAAELGAELRFDTELVDWVAESDGVLATVRTSGVTATIKARFLLAADGIRSPIRDRLGIQLVGEGFLARAVSAVFSADLSPALRGRTILAASSPTAGAILFARGDAENRIWQLGFPYLQGEDPAERTIVLARQLSGLPDLDVDVHSALVWEAAAGVASTFRSGPVFLLGDAAHAMPPYGGFGGNAAVADAHNLAWKLAAVHSGAALPDLLDTYDLERRPVAELTVSQAVARMRGEPTVDRAIVQLGYQYGRAAEVRYEDPANPSGAAGTRAPHVWLEPGRSTLDVFGRDWVLVTADRPADDLGLRVLELPGHKGVTLVRPDGFIAWRSDDTSTATLRDVIAAVRQHVIVTPADEGSC